MVLDSELQLGEGIYTFPEAARILCSAGNDVSTRQLRHWIARGLAAPVTVADADFSVLTFDDLVSLEVVRRMKARGASLQAIRRFNDALRAQFPDLGEHPFTYKVFFMDGASIWAQIDDDFSSLVELSGRRPGQYAWRAMIATFAKAIRWSDGSPPHAVAWKLTPWVAIDPVIQFGAPVVIGTRVPVQAIAANLREGTSDEVADWYGLNVETVRGVEEYLACA
jgi:uncharacterized protein (DUF433 family)/DNA-binding transcriptional MerR regulator